MLDVHVLVSEDTRKDWVNQCLRSVEVAMDRADYPIHLHVLSGVVGHIGEGRAAGYALGTAPWKTYIDDDDFVLPDAFECLLPYLDQDLAAIFPREVPEQNGKRHSFTTGRHHLCTYRSDLVEAFDHAAWVCLGDPLFQHISMEDPRGTMDLDDVVYVHRVYKKSKARILRGIYETEAQQARDFLRILK